MSATERLSKERLLACKVSGGKVHAYRPGAEVAVCGAKIGAPRFDWVIVRPAGSALDFFTCNNCVVVLTEGPDALPWGRRI